MRRRHLHTGSKPHKYQFIISDIVIHLSATSSAAVAVDNVTLTWTRGDRSTPLKRARVVERLDQTSGELSRTAAVPAELSLPCTLFRHGKEEDGRWEPKLSHIQIGDADAEDGHESVLCAVPFELSAHAATIHSPTRRSRVDLPLADGMGSISLAVCSKLLDSKKGGVGAGGKEEDGETYADSEAPTVQELDGMMHEMHHPPPTPDRGGGGGMSSSQHSATPQHHQHPPHHPATAREATEARWQEMYELERSRADAERIEKLENDISTLIHDKRQLSEECLKLRTTVQAFPQSKKELAVRVAELESQLTKARKEAAANEEHLTEAFNLVIRNLEGEVTTLTTQRDEVRRRGDHTKMRPHTALCTAAPNGHHRTAALLGCHVLF